MSSHSKIHDIHFYPSFCVTKYTCFDMRKHDQFLLQIFIDFTKGVSCVERHVMCVSYHLFRQVPRQCVKLTVYNRINL